MFERTQSKLLHLLRVPPEPEPPIGAPASVKVFRASRKLYYLRLLRWALGQAAALGGLVFWFGIIAAGQQEAARMRAHPDAGNISSLPAGKNRVALGPLRKIPPSLFKWLFLLKIAGVGAYAAQLLVTYIALRMDYQLRWYIVTDRSLRIRFGVWNVQEVTMSYANLQQVMISQGPLERLLGISNVRVESAGGGKSSENHEGHSDAMHCGVFQGVENAEQIRDMILDRLRSYRESGLGDPDEVKPNSGTHAPEAPIAAPLLPAALELLAEARALRSALSRRLTDEVNQT